MRRIAIVHTGADLATRLALSRDVLATAQVAPALGRATPFDARVIEDGPFITGGAAVAQGEAVLALEPKGERGDGLCARRAARASSVALCSGCEGT